MSDLEASARTVRALVRDVPDHPSPGILFRDITPVLADADGLLACTDGLAALADDLGVEVVAGIEARGFVLGAALAVRLGTGFVPVRKVGKLPFSTHRAAYDLEYGSAEIEVHTDAFSAGQRVLVVDDEPQIRRALRTALSGHGYDVELAVDGNTALDALALGFRTTLLTDAMAAVELQPGDGAKAIEEVVIAGGIVGSTRMR